MRRRTEPSCQPGAGRAVVCALLIGLTGCISGPASQAPTNSASGSSPDSAPTEASGMPVSPPAEATEPPLPAASDFRWDVSAYGDAQGAAFAYDVAEAPSGLVAVGVQFEHPLPNLGPTTARSPWTAGWYSSDRRTDRPLSGSAKRHRRSSAVYRSMVERGPTQPTQDLDAGVAWRVTSFGERLAVAGGSRAGSDVLERRPVWLSRWGRTVRIRIHPAGTPQVPTDRPDGRGRLESAVRQSLDHPVHHPTAGAALVPVLRGRLE